MKHEFFKDIENKLISDFEIVEKHIVFGIPYVFNNNEHLYYSLKREIKNFFNLSWVNSIIMVGSAKMGFSINPDNNFRDIQDDSDIDMVVVDEHLFDSYWMKLFEFDIKMMPRSESEDRKYKRFLKCLFKGWIRPDLFPFNFDGKKAWEEFFRSISYKEYDKRKVTGAVFKNDYFFMKYHENNIKQIREMKTYG